MKSPLTIDYDDLIKEEERHLKYIKLKYPALVQEGTMHNWTARHRISVHETLLKMLKKHKKNPQLNLEDLFKQVPKPRVVPMPPGPENMRYDDPDFYTTLD